MNTFLSHAETLCRQIAPKDLAGVPLYVILQSRLSVRLGGASICDGFTAPSLDLLLRPAIGPAWAGRGPCLVVNDVALRAESDPRDFEQAVLTVVLHELAHILQRPALYADRPGVDPDRLAFEALVLADAVGQEERNDVLPYHGHDWQFIRVALHLCHRAGVAGATVAPPRLCAGHQYGLSHALRYQLALGDEPEQLASMSVRDIHHSMPPPAFIALWLADLQQFRFLICPERNSHESPASARKDHEKAPRAADEPGCRVPGNGP